MRQGGGGVYVMLVQGKDGVAQNFALTGVTVVVTWLHVTGGRDAELLETRTDGIH